MFIKPKPKKFWSPGLIMPLGGKTAVGAIAASSIGVSITASLDSSTHTISTQTFTFPAVASGNLLVVSVHLQNGTPAVTSIIYDPTGANVTLTPESGIGTAPPVIASGVIPSFAGGSKVVQITFASAANFLSFGCAAWLVTGQTVNSAQNSKRQLTSNLTSFSVVAGQIILASVLDASLLAGSFMANSSPVGASSGTTAGTSKIGEGIWNANITTTASYTINGFGIGNPADGTVAATYV